MAYALTEKDIADMIAAGMNVMDAIPGAPATDAEKKFLGVQEDVEPSAFPEPVALAPAVATQQASSFNPAGTTAQSPIMSVGDVGSQMQDLSAATPPVNMQGQLSAAQDASPSFLSSIGETLFGPQEAGDQFANLNRQQRMMLAFGAVKDAGFALQGKESNSFSSTLKAINDQMDMGRKAKAAQAQKDALQSMMGAGGVGGDIQSQIARLSDMAVMYPSMAPGLALKIKALQDQAMAQTSAESRASQASTQLQDVDDLLDLINEDPFMTTGIMGSIISIMPGTDAATAEGLATSLRSNLALQALKDLKSTGATMGALNTKEFNALETELTQLTLRNGPKYAKRSLKRIQTKYQNLIADAFRDAKEQAAAGNPMGQKGLDGLNRIFGAEPEWVSTAGPVVPSDEPSGPRDGETAEEFKIRMGL
tara:strand:+ start:677 stop:1942 length:1266 start_codon:yes stop_codon:yes gene_type:complete